MTKTLEKSMKVKKVKPLVHWTPCGQFTDIKYHKAEGIAKITINRPQVRNAFRPLTVMEMSQALNEARDDEKIGVMILTGRCALVRNRSLRWSPATRSAAGIFCIFWRI